MLLYFIIKIEAIFGEKLQKKDSSNLENEQLIEEIKEEEDIENDPIVKQVKEIELHYKKYLYRSLNTNNIYILSIIDYLQLYNFYKFMETKVKFYIKTRPDKVEAISCVPPDIYCQRFIEYIQKITNFDIQV